MSQYTIAVTGHLTNDPYVTRFDNDKINTRLRIASSRRLRTVRACQVFCVWGFRSECL